MGPAGSVTIEGAGIAGRVLARELALRGIPARLVDKSPFPRDKVCGGVLQPSSWRYLRSVFAVREPARPVPAIEHHWRGRRISRIELRDPFIFVSRLKLDHALEAGPEPPPDAGPVLRVRATGAFAPGGDWLGFHGRCPPVEELRMHYGRGIYLGMSPTPEGDASHAAFIVRKELFGGTERLAAFLERELGVRFVSPLKGTGPIRYGCSDGGLAVGDAALTTHPFLGLGMKHAILSARLLAGCIGRGEPEAYPREHRRRFAKIRRASALAARLYGSELLRWALWPVLRWKGLFLPAYRWLHEERF
jgi:2-polyprenyl-6-methoxyphenol hydroxylase-like FAD-dependent oxidoreductase